jgi:hypothetical protein
MSRVRMAFVAFFRLLFKGSLPEEAAEFLPVRPRELDAAEPPQEVAPIVAAPMAPTPPPVAAPTPARGDLRTEGALMLLGLLQREGRLVDFLREPLDSYDDAAIGAAVRDVHRGCRKVLEEHLALEPVMPGQEEAPVTVPRGFDPGEIRLVGRMAGEPPFRGTLVHPGWRAVDVHFPTLADGVDRRVLAPAEVRLP